MSTILFADHIFGPIHSRRLGRSLGVNLLPASGKWCNYNCIYCECGWNTAFTAKPVLPSVADIAAALESRLQELRGDNMLPDAITFSGNGEPTLHPQFAAIMDEIIMLRTKYAPTAKICVLTNATNLDSDSVCGALCKADVTMLKLDAGNDSMLKLINQPQTTTANVRSLLRSMQEFGRSVDNMVVQTMFLRGEVGGVVIDNSLHSEVECWLECLRKLRPREVAIYSIDRATPAERLQKISPQRLHEIAEQVRDIGITAVVY
jgi:wyosine [tRNA(Phe)-imidazoG37] synthetase (radical SAM superfamily)